MDIGGAERAMLDRGRGRGRRPRARARAAGAERAVLSRKYSSNIGFGVVVVVVVVSPPPLSSPGRRRRSSYCIPWSSSASLTPTHLLLWDTTRVFHLSAYGRNASVMHLECVTAHSTQSRLTSRTPKSRPKLHHLPHAMGTCAKALMNAMGIQPPSTDTSTSSSTVPTSRSPASGHTTSRREPARTYTASTEYVGEPS